MTIFNSKTMDIFSIRQVDAEQICIVSVGSQVQYTVCTFSFVNSIKIFIFAQGHTNLILCCSGRNGLQMRSVGQFKNKNKSHDQYNIL